jgi:DNA-binding transcriptional MerR regulator
VSVRTLHHYDHLGLLKPAAVRPNGYRAYGEKELLRLQQIFYFRELDLDLARIRRIFDAPRFDVLTVFEEQRELLSLKRGRLGRLIKLIDKTIRNMKDEKEEKVTEQDLRECFAQGKYEEYRREAEERWGSDKVARSENITKGWSKGRLEEIKREGDAINRALVLCMGEGPESAEAQAAVARHYAHIIQFYDPSWPLLSIYRGLGQMYVDDPHFRQNYEKYAPGLAEFMRAAMNIFCDRRKEEKDGR